MTEQRRKRCTRQKLVIYDVLRSTTCHPTAEWIYSEARKQIPDLSRGTVYRNLQALRQEKMIVELNYGKSQSRYDGNTNPHFHFVCQQCGRVFDFFGDDSQIKSFIATSAPGMVSYFRLECYGVCNDCQNNNGVL